MINKSRYPSTIYSFKNIFFRFGLIGIFLVELFGKSTIFKSRIRIFVLFILSFLVVFESIYVLGVILNFWTLEILICSFILILSIGYGSWAVSFFYEND